MSSRFFVLTKKRTILRKGAKRPQRRIKHVFTLFRSYEKAYYPAQGRKAPAAQDQDSFFPVELMARVR